MVQHVLLGMAVPLLVVLSAPLTLALQAAGPATRHTLRTALHSPPAHVVAHPVVAWALFGGGLVVIYLTPLLGLSVRHDSVHLLVHAHVVIAGTLFLAVLVGIDPLPGRPPPAARLLALLVAVPFHAVVGLALLSAGSPVAPDAYPCCPTSALRPGCSGARASCSPWSWRGSSSASGGSPSSAPRPARTPPSPTPGRSLHGPRRQSPRPRPEPRGC